MREIRIACFSDLGEMLARRLGTGEVTRFPGSSTLSEWTEEGFRSSDALIFVASLGIAVRSIAPFIESKLTDPAVLAIDETGAYVIPVLSGHIGGANVLAGRIAQMIGAHPVITTATDRRHTFAADSWAAENGFGIVNPEAVKAFSAAVLYGDEIVLRIRKACAENCCASPELKLIPRTVVIGAGCRKGADLIQMEKCLHEFCKRHGIEPQSICCIASIDLKKNEPALKQLAARRKIPFLTFHAQELMEIKGDFASSEFVLRTIGADNVCERAAVRAAIEMDGADLNSGVRERLFVRKESFEGVTLAAARREVIRSWEWL